MSEFMENIGPLLFWVVILVSAVLLYRWESPKKKYVLIGVGVLVVAFFWQACSCDQWFNQGCPMPWEKN